jgi:hypothetical protein
MNRPRRKRGGAYNFPALRRREIERHARDVGAAHTEDFWRWIVAWRWHNEQNSRDPAGALILAAKRMGGSLTEAGAERILETADALPRCCTADKLGKFLGVTYAQRQRLAITTIGSIDVNKRSRALLRKRKNRLHNERKRRAQGIRPRAAYKENSLMHIKPWEAEGISRRTWYRRKRGTGPSPPIAPLQNGGTNGTDPSAAFLSLPADALVPPERKQGRRRGRACPQYTVLPPHRVSWCWRTEFISLGARSRRERGCVACATMAGCSQTCARRRQNDQDRPAPN